MKTALLVVCTMLVVAAAGFAATPSATPLSSEALAAILGDAGPCATQPSAVPVAAKRPVLFGEKSLCTATANCASGTVTCSSNTSPSSCSAVDRSCPERGHVTCDGVTTYCPQTCSICDTCDATGDCVACCRCDGGGVVACRRICDPFP